MQSASQPVSQRRHQRYILSKPLVLIRKLSSTDLRREPGISTEIGEGGMAAIVAVPLNVGDAVQLSLDVAPGKTIVVDAVVRHRYLFRHGFEFVRLSDENREQIRAVCASLRAYEGGWY